MIYNVLLNTMDPLDISFDYLRHLGREGQSLHQTREYHQI